MAKVKITNTLTKTISDAEIDNTVISPTCVPTPATPVEEYVSDMVTITDGILKFPAYNKVQYIEVPFEGSIEFEVTDYKEIAYYKSLKLAGGTVEVEEAAAGGGTAIV